MLMPVPVTGLQFNVAGEAPSPPPLAGGYSDSLNIRPLAVYEIRIIS
jgi:hypothetical protein